MFARVVNGAVVELLSWLPDRIALPDGALMLGFNATDADTQRGYGYYPVVDITTGYDERIHDKGAPIYQVQVAKVTVDYSYTAKPFAELQRAKITEVYGRCAAILNGASEGYSPVEVASFPALQKEITLYNSNSVVGPYMQAVIDRGRHTAASLSAALTPKIALEQSALTARDNHVAAIMALQSPLAVADYDVTVGWLI